MFADNTLILSRKPSSVLRREAIPLKQGVWMGSRIVVFIILPCKHARMKGELEGCCLPLELLTMMLNMLWSGTQMPHWQVLFKKSNRKWYLWKLSWCFVFLWLKAGLHCAFSVIVKTEEAVAGLPWLATVSMDQALTSASLSYWWLWRIIFFWGAMITNSHQDCLNTPDATCRFTPELINCIDRCMVW